METGRKGGGQQKKEMENANASPTPQAEDREKQLSVERVELKPRNRDNRQRVELPDLDIRSYDPAKDRERMRGKIAIGLISIPAAIILFAFAALVTKTILMPELKELLTIFFGPMAALAGTAIGFYFGGKA